MPHKAEADACREARALSRKIGKAVYVLQTNDGDFWVAPADSYEWDCQDTAIAIVDKKGRRCLMK